MRKIVLVCAGGMSTSILAKRMEEAALAANYEVAVEAFSSAVVDVVAKTADIVLVGPQVRYQLDKIKEQVGCPVALIDMKSYGMMDGEAVIAQVKQVLKD